MENKTKKVEIEIPVGKVAKWVDGVLTLVDEKPQDVTERIKTFADACRELGSDHPFVKAYDGYLSHIHQHNMNDYDLVSYLQLRIITAALNEGWEPQFTKGERRWYFWYDLITKEQYDKLSAEDKSRVVGRGGDSASAYCGLVYASAVFASSLSHASDGSRLAFKSEKLAASALPFFQQTNCINMAAKEITKEDCRQLYNLYAQVETSESIIKDLENFVKSQGERVPDIIPKSYQTHGSIEINIPYFENGKFAEKGARVYHISYPAALRVLKNHVRHLKKEIKQMNERLLKGGNDEND